MQQRSIGDRQVGAIGLGAMPMSVEGRPDRERSLATIHAALDAGVTLIDTADAYHLGADEVGHDETGHNEQLVAEPVRGLRSVHELIAFIGEMLIFDPGSVQDAHRIGLLIRLFFFSFSHLLSPLCAGFLYESTPLHTGWRGGVRRSFIQIRPPG